MICETPRGGMRVSKFIVWPPPYRKLDSGECTVLRNLVTGESEVPELALIPESNPIRGLSLALRVNRAVLTLTAPTHPRPSWRVEGPERWVNPRRSSCNEASGRSDSCIVFGPIRIGSKTVVFSAPSLLSVRAPHAWPLTITAPSLISALLAADCATSTRPSESKTTPYRSAPPRRSLSG